MAARLAICPTLDRMSMLGLYNSHTFASLLLGWIAVR